MAFLSGSSVSYGSIGCASLWLYANFEKINSGC
jgi:hypothetical protein